eukprot:TRINITY_DN29343_c0_g1_i1.p1 TRINITY_DN29343_c0_g1~~TRINITY_DN29343_c0_g1_i1.p1  ORF type:complete len:480 (+),score=93.08 TRINITY_DN29343_c0_g1_i1:465-1904(+)
MADRLAAIGRHLKKTEDFDEKGRGENGQHVPSTSIVRSSTSASPSFTEVDDAASGTEMGVLSVFPQATTAAKFPPATFDYFLLDELLPEPERALRKKVRSFMEKEVAPIIVPYWEKAEFPYELIPKFAELKVAGTTIKGYGCPGMSVLGSAIVVSEIARVDASCSTFIMVHTCLGMLTIDKCGSEKQKQKYLPLLARLDGVACWALTEPNFGSDASSLNTVATKVSGGWLLNGQKRWIGNSTFAEVVVVFARNESTNQINCFIVRRGAPGFLAKKMENKIGLRIVQNGDLTFTNVFVPDDDRLPGVNSFQDTAKVLAISRIMVAWQPVGMAMGVYDMCRRYLSERQQFGAPLSALALNQEKLVRMLGNVQAMFLLGWRLCQLYESGKMTPGQASMAKAWNTLRARETMALGRELLGGNGIVSDFLVAKAFCDLEPIYTYEGSYEINALVTGREVTGVAAIKPPAAFSRSAKKIGDRAMK